VVLFLHVFLAYPSGRLQGRFERALVASAYSGVLGFSLLGLLLGGSGGDSLLTVVSKPGAADVVLGVQRVSIAALALAGFGVLVARMRFAERPLRRSPQLLVSSFVLALVMISLGILVSEYYRAAE
jgi:hypothetical protein